MNQLDNLLEERLTRLEAGESLELCLVGLPDDEAALLKKAALLRAIADAEPAADKVTAQRNELLRLAQQNKKMTSQVRNTPSSRPRWLLPTVAFSSLVALTLVCMLVVSAGSGLIWLWQQSQSASVAQNTTDTPIAGATQAVLGPVATPEVIAVEASDPQSAALNSSRGLIEIQTNEGAWVTAKNGEVVRAGQRLRAGALSSAALAFYDGSRARLGPNSEVSVDTLDAQTSGGPRIVLLTQWVGDSNHQVAASTDPASRYEVHTPSGIGTAKGTAFHVFVSSTLLTRFDVDEGAVSVTSLSVTVIVVAGQSTVIISGQPPSEPTFRIKGEGEVFKIGNSWRVAGNTFLTNLTTVVVGDPQVGDWVSFEARTLADGSRLADRISLLHRAPENRFAFSGIAENMSSEEWTISGRSVRISEDTEIGDDIEVGDQVAVEGGIAQGGTLWAARIRLIEPEKLPFEFTGVVESIGNDSWMISGRVVAIDEDTRIEGDIEIGDIVRVKGQVLEDGNWLAKSVRLVEKDKREFEIVGPVESMAPWVVAGVEFATDDRTEIDDDIEAGDRVRVKGRILDDGTWLAEEIQRLEEGRPRRFKFVGEVTGMDPWVVGGIELTVNENTEIKGDIAVGNFVRVEGRILEDGAWLAQKIKRLDSRLGCLSFSTVIRSADAQQIVLLDWRAVKLGEGIEVKGEVKVAAVVIVFGCVQEDGELVIINVIVVYQLDSIPIVVIKPPSDNGGGGDGDHHDEDDSDDD